VERIRTAVLISGRGSNLAALLRAAEAEDYPAKIVLVISDHAEAAGLGIAATAGVAVHVLDRQVALGTSLAEALDSARIELVCLAGFMRLLPATLVERWQGRMLNIHPSLLPAFPGLDTHRRALEAGVRCHGCTAHFVRAELDAGPIIVQGVVPVRPEDTADTLAARVLAVEHRCYPLALELVASGRARVEGRRVVLEGSAASEQVLINPPLATAGP
jgi:phosphoribosylglycinamide formyltransferase-1